MNKKARDFPLYPKEVTNDFLSKCFGESVISFELDTSMTAGGVLADAFRVFNIKYDTVNELPKSCFVKCTKEIPEVVEFNERTGKEVIHVIDFKGEIYTRQEQKGILLGTYEQACEPWSPIETPWTFGHELLEPNLERISPSLEVGFKHFPPLEKAGIRKMINGPFTFAPDGNPLIGPVPGLTNYWSACAVMAGFSQGGGV